jgi:hypothetical protein
MTSTITPLLLFLAVVSLIVFSEVTGPWRENIAQMVYVGLFAAFVFILVSRTARSRYTR